MKNRILDDLQKLIDSISYGDIRRNDIESALENIKDEIEAELTDITED